MIFVTHAERDDRTLENTCYVLSAHPSLTRDSLLLTRQQISHMLQTLSYLQFILGGHSHAQIKIPLCRASHRPFARAVESNPDRVLWRDLHGCRSVPCLQEL